MEEHIIQTRDTEEAIAVDGLLQELVSSFEGGPDDLIPMLQVVQRKLGYLPERALEEIARLTGRPAASVYGVATFYAQFRLQPVGKHIIKVCRGTACHVRGSGRIQRDIESRLHVVPGETTGDRQFTLETVACFGSCALAPVIVADETVHGRMNASSCARLLDELSEPTELDSADEPNKE
jgi:NADH-quinone oxidoreductase subunit E